MDQNIETIISMKKLAPVMATNTYFPRLEWAKASQTSSEFTWTVGTVRSLGGSKSKRKLNSMQRGGVLCWAVIWRANPKHFGLCPGLHLPSPGHRSALSQAITLDHGVARKKGRGAGNRNYGGETNKKLKKATIPLHAHKTSYRPSTMDVEWKYGKGKTKTLHDKSTRISSKQ